MSDWLNIPVKERIGLLREYKKLGYSYSSAKKDFEDSLSKYEGGGTLTPSIKQREDHTANFIGKLYKNKLDKRHGDFARYYLGLPLNGDRELEYSNFIPSTSTNKNVRYIAYKNKNFEDAVIQYFNENYNGETLRPNYSTNPQNSKDWKTYQTFNDLGNFKISKGKDNKGEYISYYDVWNYGRNDTPNMDKTEFFGTVKPYEIYDRLYLDKDEETSKYKRKEIPSIPLPNTKPLYHIPNQFEQGGVLPIEPLKRRRR